MILHQSSFKHSVFFIFFLSSCLQESLFQTCRTGSPLTCSPLVTTLSAPRWLWARGPARAAGTPPPAQTAGGAAARGAGPVWATLSGSSRGGGPGLSMVTSTGQCPHYMSVSLSVTPRLSNVSSSQSSVCSSLGSSRQSHHSSSSSIQDRWAVSRLAFIKLLINTRH